MGVDDVGPVTAKGSHQIAESPRVVAGRDRPHEAVHLGDLHARVDRGEDLRLRLSAVHEHDGVAGTRELITGNNRVFICATVHETCNDVSNP
jgi:hypothetical protein